MTVNVWEMWDKYFANHPLVVAHSLTPQPWENADETFDQNSLCMKVFLKREPTPAEFASFDFPELIEGFPVQYIHPGTFLNRPHFSLPGDSGSLVYYKDGTPVGLVVAVHERLRITTVCPASEIERILNISFVPSDGGGSATEVEDDDLPRDRKDRFEILVSGISIGHRRTTGTLGCFVWDKDNGEVLGLTCAHVAAPPGATVGDTIYQPSPSDIRTHLNREPTDDDIAGHLVRWHEISYSATNTIDAALFRPTRPISPTYVFEFGERPLVPPARDTDAC